MSSADDSTAPTPSEAANLLNPADDPGTGKKRPDTPAVPKHVDFPDVGLEKVKQLEPVDEDEDDDEAVFEDDLPRDQALLKNALRRSSSVTQEPEPRRFSINERRRGSWGQGVFLKPDLRPRRPSIPVQEVRRRSSALPSVKEEDEEPTPRPAGPRRESIVVQQLKTRRSLIPKVEEDEEEEPPRSPSTPRIQWGPDVEDKERGDVPKEDVEKGELESGSTEAPGRATWGGSLEFLLTCVGYAVGLGNVWRFPYLCYKNGGGAFLIPYILMLALVGLPLFFMELAFGQFASLGPIAIWKINPLLKGLGYGMVIVSWMIGLYYNVVIAHTLFYLFASMTSVLPWTTCDNDWNTEACLLPPSKSTGNSTLNGTIANGTTALLNVTSTVAAAAKNITGTKTPSEEYYYNYVLEQSSGIDEFGLPSWKLTLCLLLAWIVVLASLLKGIQSLGKVVYFTAIFPYVMLTVLLIRGLTLDGAGGGILYYLKPDFSRLADSRVWSDATTQIFYSLSACSGGLIAMSSFNKFDNNCLKDSLIVALINCGTSIFAGFVIFSVLGFMAYEKGVDVGDVAAGGPGLAFIVYPEAISRMPVAPLWAILFFIMMATLGFGSQFSMMECVLSAFTDEFIRFIKGQKENIIFRCSVIGLSFLLGVPMVCKGGIYLLNLVDYSVSGFPLLVMGLLELIALNWIYGFSRFAEDIKMMLGHKPNIYWKACWMVLSPVIILVTIVFNMIFYKPPELDGYLYPEWAKAIGWLISLWPILMIPGWFMYRYCRDGGYALLKEAIKPKLEWGPALSENRTEVYSDFFVGEDNDGYISSKSTIFSTRENLSQIIVTSAKNRQNRNGSVKGQSPATKDEADGELAPTEESPSAPGKEGVVYTSCV